MADDQGVAVTHADIRIISRAARIGQTLKTNPQNAMRAEFEAELATLSAKWKALSPETRSAAAAHVATYPDLLPESVPEAITTLEG